MTPPKDELSHWDELFRLVDENEELEKKTTSAETPPNSSEGAEQNSSLQAVPARPAADSLKSWILLASIPITLFLVLGFLGLKAYFDLSASIKGLQDQIAQRASETQMTPTEQTEEASNELRLEHTKLEQKLVAAQVLSSQLEQQLAATARGEAPQPAPQPPDTQPPVQSSLNPPRERDAPIDHRRSYRLGAQGPVVAQIQRRLQELGYYNDEADGVFDRKTRRAVRAFQRREHLRADGVVGGKTLKKLLFKDLAW